jgi:hypothetical protein
MPATIWYAIFALLFVEICVTGGVLWERRRARVARDVLDRWVRHANLQLQIVTAKSPFLRFPPFWFTHAQYIFRITVQDASGAHRNGWVRIGGWVSGLFSDEIKVVWDD